MSNALPTKPVVSIKVMASMCGLSYQRFAQLRREGYFPAPLVDEDSNRKYYDEELQKTCLLVRQRNMGINGKQIIFYSARRNGTARPSKPRKKPTTKPTNKHAALVEAVKSLGMPDVTPQQIAAAVRELLPDDTADTPETEIVRSVFVHLMQKNSGS